MAGIVGRKWTRRTKQCCVCRVHFVPHPRVGERQRTCGRDECRREHQRRRSADWHAAHPGYDKAERLRARLRKETDIASGDDAGGLSGSGGTAPARQVDWAVARAVMGVEGAVIVEEAHQVAVERARMLMRTEVLGNKGESAQVPPPFARAAICARSPPP